MPFLLAALLAAVLAIPGFRFAYVFDDYNFLSRAETFRWAHYLPDSNDVFYRPVSRDLYFGILEAISPGSPLAGHVINALLLITVVLLGGLLAREIAGARAGIIASLLLAGFGQFPVLVAWVCGSQDLLAITFLLFALHAEMSRARAEALMLFVLAALSKETAIVAAPALIAIPWLQRGSRRASLVYAAQVGAILSAWFLFHPGIRSLFARGGFSVNGTYIGFDNPTRWTALLQSVAALLNLPLTGNPTPWPAELTRVLAIAALPFLALLWFLARRESGAEFQETDSTTWSMRRCVALGALIGVPPLFLTCLVVKHWVPYYTCFSAVGLAIAVAPLLLKARTPALVACLSIYLVCGVWSRGVELAPGMPSERGLGPAGEALRRLEGNFKRVEPTLAPGAIVYVTTMATGTQSVYLHLHAFQALRVWYRDASIQTLRPELHISSSAPEYLFWVDPQLNVFEVDVHSLSVRSAGAPVEVRRYRSVMRSYAIGLATSGDVQRAVDILLHLDAPDTWDHAISYRIAAMLLYSAGMDSVADTMLRGIPPIPGLSAFGAVVDMLTVPTRPNQPLERYALRAFGFSWDDPVVLRGLMRSLVKLSYNDVSGRLADRILVLVPGDPEAVAVLKQILPARGAGGNIFPPIPPFKLPGS